MSYLIGLLLKFLQGWMGMVSKETIMFNVYNWKDVHEISLHLGRKINKQQNIQESS